MAPVKYLLDTNIVSEIVNPEPFLPVMQRFMQHRQELSISTITWHEMNYGVSLMDEGKRKRRLQNYLSQVIGAYLPIYDYTREAAEWHAEQREKLKRQGIETSYPDGQIAAIAATKNLIVVTRNVKDFEHLNGLEIENWFEASSEEE